MYVRDREFQMTVVNVFRDGEVWCESVWINGEFSHSDTIDYCDSPDPSVIICAAKNRWSGAIVSRVSDI